MYQNGTYVRFRYTQNKTGELVSAFGSSPTRLCFGPSTTTINGFMGRDKPPKVVASSVLRPAFNASSQPTPVKSYSSLFRPSRVFQAPLSQTDCQLQLRLKQRACQSRHPSDRRNSKAMETSVARLIRLSSTRKKPRLLSTQLTHYSLRLRCVRITLSEKTLDTLWSQ